MSASVERMAFRGSDPWWIGTSEDVGQWTKVERFDSIWEAILVSGLDFKVYKVPVYVQEFESIPDSDEEYLRNVYHQDEAFYTRPKYKELEGVYQLVREGDRKPYGQPVGSQYTPLQIDEVGQFFEEFVKEGHMDIETIGLLDDGRIWVLADWGKVEAVRPHDEVEHYFLFSHGHGSVPVTVGDTITRVVCKNTLEVALNKGQKRHITIKHTRNIRENLDVVRQALDVANMRFVFTMEQYRKLDEGICLPDGASFEHAVILALNPTKQFETTDCLPEAANLEETFSTRTINMVNQIKDNVYDSMKEEGRSHATWWDGYNGITKFLTHQAQGTDAQRQTDLWLGGYRQKQNERALAVCLRQGSREYPRQYIKRADRDDQ